MRVVFDAYWWVSGPAAVRRVLREIILTWRTQYPEDELVLVVRKRHADSADVPAGVQVEASGLYPQGLLARRAIARTARRRSADAVLTHNFAARTDAVSAVYLHDVLFRTNPEWFTPAERAYFSLMVRWAPSADVVFTSSRSEAARIRANTAARSVLPVGLGLSRELIDSSEVEPLPGLSEGSFVLTVGRMNARKNLGGAIAGALASGRISPQMPLVLVGAADGRPEELGDAAREAVQTGAVRELGHVSDPQLRWLYRHCAAFVYVSLGEGYGMPPTEALAFGAAPVVSDLPVFREILGDRAEYVDPRDPGSVGAGIRKVLDRGRSVGGVAVGTTWEETVGAIRGEIARLVEVRSHPPR